MLAIPIVGGTAANLQTRYAGPFLGTVVGFAGAVDADGHTRRVAERMIEAS